MAHFKYRAKKPTGEEVTDSLESDSAAAAAKRIAANGLIPIHISQESDPEQSHSLFERVNMTDVIMFTRQLVTLYKAGLPFLSSLDAIGKQTSNPALRRVLHTIRHDVEAGQTLSAALAKHPKVFPEVYIATVVAGETGGVLDKLLDRLVTLLENEMETRRTLKAALRYPVLVLGAMTTAFLVIVTFVIPAFSKLFSQVGQSLPLPTRIMVGINAARQNYWHVILLGVAALVGLAIWYLRTPKGRMNFDKFVLICPLAGSIIMKASMARLAHTFATLSDSGLPILKELNVISHIIGNRRISQQIDAVRDAVQEGSTMAVAIDQKTDFPPLVKHMIAVGEKTGAMSDMMQAVGDHYDRETKESIARLTQALEPLITLVLGAGLLFIALAVFLPMWDMMKVMNK